MRWAVLPCVIGLLQRPSTLHNVGSPNALTSLLADPPVLVPASAQVAPAAPSDAAASSEGMPRKAKAPHAHTANASKVAATCRADDVCRCKIFGDGCRGSLTMAPSDEYPQYNAVHYCRVYGLCGDDLPDHLRLRAQRQSLAAINRMYKNGVPSNTISRAGLFVHQHDSTEQWDKPVYDVSCESWPHWAGSIISRSVPGLYNTDCGVIVAPQAVQVLCSYYADFTSWNEGCSMDDIVGSVHGHAMSRPPSRPRNRPYDGPDQLKEMLEMSLELQNGSAAMPREEWGTRGERRTRARRRRLRAEGNGEPDRWDFWDGYYNEVLINRSWYAARLPRAVAGIFYLSGGWEEEDGRQCAQRTLDRMRAQYGDAAADVSVFALTPGEGFSLPADRGG